MKIRVNIFNATEMFQHSSDNAMFEETREMVFGKHDLNICRDIHGKGDYVAGQHTMSFKIEQLNG